MEIDTTMTWGGLPAPRDWHAIDIREDGAMWERLVGQRIKVIESVSIESDGRKWLHVSVSKPSRKMPTYEDIQEARKWFVGEHRECYQVFPTKDRYININPVLHLWACLDEPDGVLPHFEGMANIGGKVQLSV